MKSSSLAAWLALLVTPCAGGAATFQGLGGHPTSTAYSISADGQVVVGSGIVDGVRQAFRWTAATGMVGLSAMGSSGVFGDFASSASEHGDVVVGQGYSSAGYEATAWTAFTGTVGLGGPFPSAAHAVSADGGTIVGVVALPGNVSGVAAYRQGSSGWVSLGTLTGSPQNSQANGVSADGAVIVGTSVSAFGNDAFRWTAATGMVALGDLPNPPPNQNVHRSSALAVSADGSVVVGRGIVGPFRWTAQGGMKHLGELPGASGGSQPEARAVSADGSIVVGYSRSFADASQAFVWDATNGMCGLANVLNGLGVDTTGWRVEEANGIAADGRTIAGTGRHEVPQLGWVFEAWAATIPQPLPPVPLGDANRNGRVDGADLLYLYHNWGRSGAGLCGGDFNQTGIVTAADYTIWADNYGNTTVAAPVPEPESLILGAVAFVGCVAVAWNRRHRFGFA